LSRRTHIAAAFATFWATFAVSAAPAATLTTTERSLLVEMNRVRAAHGLQRLRIAYRLQLAARAHARDMLRRDYFAHGPFLSRILSYGASGPVFGENLAWGAGSRAQARAVVAGWLASPGHRSNLLRTGFQRVGVAAPSGRFRGIAGVRMVTADFAGR
jgi:uncharacterized protein YkwD